MQVIYLCLLLYTNKKFLRSFKINKIIEIDYCGSPCMYTGKKNTRGRSRVKIKSNKTHCLGS